MDEYIKLFNAPIECCEWKKIPKNYFMKREI